MPKCLCTRPAGDANLCKTCGRDFVKALAEIPFLVRQLEIVTTRQARHSTPNDGGRSTVTPLPFHSAASDTRIKLQAALEGAARKLIRDTCPTSPRADDVSAWLALHVNEIRHHHEAHALVRKIMDPTTKAWTLIDRPADRWYAGRCNAVIDGAECGRELYAQAWAAIVECSACHWQHDVAARREWLLDAAEDQLANAATAARAVTWLSETPVTPHRIAMWVKRKRLHAKAHEPYGSATDPERTRPLYRIGDVLDLLGDS